MRSKKQNQRRHSRRRASERYGVRLHQDLRTKIIQTIQTGSATLVAKQSNRVSVFDVSVEGQDARVVYDNKRKELVSFLPRDNSQGIPVRANLP